MRDVRVSFPKPCDAPWEAMVPTGCNRLCARCDTMVHDLAELTLEQAQALLRRDPAACVRARVDADGVVTLKPDPGSTVRRMIATVAAAASAGVLASGAPAVAAQKHDRAVISGKVAASDWPTRITATAADGMSRRARMKPDGSFKIRRLRAGIYTLTFTPSCGDAWTVKDVEVADNQPLTLQTTDPDPCIIIGALRIEPDLG